MRTILVIGGHGVIGSAVVTALKQHCSKYGIDARIVIGARNVKDNKEVYVDLNDSASIKALFTNDKLRGLTDIVCCAGKSLRKDIAMTTREDIKAAFDEKVFGQMQLVLETNRYFCANPRRPNEQQAPTVTLTSGCTAFMNTKLYWGAAAQNAALNRFVQTTVMETPSICVNVVSPGVLTESVPKIGHLFAGFRSVDSCDVAQAYVRCVFGYIRGKVLNIDGAKRWIQSKL